MNLKDSLHTINKTITPGTAQEKAPASKPQNKWLIYFLQLIVCLFLSITFGTVIVLLDGQNPIAVYSALIQQAFFTPLGFMIAIQRATPLILTSAAGVIAFQGGAINMGLEGQFMVGAAVAAVAGYAVPDMPKIFSIPLIFLLCGLGGAAAGWIPAVFKMVSGVSEVITGMIANLIIPSLMSLILSLPFLRMARSGVSQHGIQPWAQLDQFNELTHGGLGFGTKANTGIFVALGIVIILAIWLKRTKIGFEIRISSANYAFAEFAGINAKRSFYLTLMLSGAIAAMAGATEILGVWRGYNMGTISVGYNGLLIALAGGNTFGGSMIASLIYGGLQSGAMNASWVTDISRPLIDVLVEIIVLFAAIPSMRLFFSGSAFTDAERLGGQFTHKD